MKLLTLLGVAVLLECAVQAPVLAAGPTTRPDAKADIERSNALLLRKCRQAYENGDACSGEPKSCRDRGLAECEANFGEKATAAEVAAAVKAGTGKGAADKAPAAKADPDPCGCDKREGGKCFHNRCESFTGDERKQCAAACAAEDKARCLASCTKGAGFGGAGNGLGAAGNGFGAAGNGISNGGNQPPN